MPQEASMPKFRLSPNAPVRVLVKTLTHLVPNDYPDQDDLYKGKSTSMLRRILRQHWEAGSDLSRIRWQAYGGYFAYDNRLCYFLLDHGTVSIEEERNVPILCYEWTGERLKLTPSILNGPRVREYLRMFPFMPRPQRSPSQGQRIPVRNMVRIRLRRAQKILKEELRYLFYYPHDTEWLRQRVNLKLWGSFVRQADALWEETSEDERSRIMARQAAMAAAATGGAGRTTTT